LDEVVLIGEEVDNSSWDVGKEGACRWVVREFEGERDIDVMRKDYRIG
jgi:hypothetical protein